MYLDIELVEKICDSMNRCKISLDTKKENFHEP